ncbi:MAG: GNAT family N-acetyltransferase [Deinococcales bacterium]
MNYLEPVTLEGKHIRLEPLDPATHAPEMFVHFEPRVTEFLSRGGKPIESASDLAAHLSELNTVPQRLNWAVRIIKTGAVAGRISYSQVNPQDKWIEVGTMLMPAFWGSTANPEGKLLLLTRAFEILGANRVQFKVDARNERSQGSMAKIGAVREGILRQYQIRPDGYVRDSVMYSVLASEWAEVKQKLETRL